ncbi:MAG: hypothetical protein JF888_10680 [Candidatus Dormibacteraeota bacterium]|uniref:Toxin-antitoxin system HicB family antitoxin n=1 Tax=Candidatus Dormiibacter inghamiae TaxID=3127013 RepID=A0A934KJ28_9BACT|nr:hypothetical protein [Candidatus Dormibacteraeota bacterium]
MSAVGGSTSTLRIPRALLDRIEQLATVEGLSVVEFLQKLLQEEARRVRFAAVRQAYAQLSHAEMKEYREEARAWDVTLADGLR